MEDQYQTPDELRALLGGTTPNPLVQTGMIPAQFPSEDERKRALMAQMNKLANRDLLDESPGMLSLKEDTKRIGGGGLATLDPKKEGIPAVASVGLNLLLSRLGLPPMAAGALAGMGTAAAREMVDPSDGIPQAGAKLLLDMGFGGAGGALGGALEAPVLRGERNLQATAKFGAAKAAYTAGEQSRARAGRAADINAKEQIADMEGTAAASPTYQQRPNSPAWVPKANQLTDAKMAFVNSAAKAFGGDSQKFATYMELPESKVMLRKLYPDTAGFDERHTQLTAFLKRSNSPMPPEPIAPTMERSPLLNAKHAMSGPMSHLIGHTPTHLVMATIPTSDIVQKFMTASPAFRTAALDWANTGALRMTGGYGGQAFANWISGNTTTKVDKPAEQQDIPNLRKLLEP